MAQFYRLEAQDIWTPPTVGGGLTAVADASAKYKWFPINKRIATIKGVISGDVTPGASLLYFSPDGDEFVTITLPSGATDCLDVAEAPDGGLWGLFINANAPGGGAGYTAKVFVSTDVGVSWTLKYTLPAGYQAFNIAVSPVRFLGSIRIAFTYRNAQGFPGSNGSAYGAITSEDSGNTWLPRLINMQAITDEANAPLVSWQRDRLIVWFPGEATETFPVFESFTAQVFNSAGTSHLVALPATILLGELILILFQKNLGDTVATPPAGFAEIFGTTSPDPGDTLYLFAKRADGTEGGTNVNIVTSDAAKAIAHTHRVSNWFGVVEGGVEAAVDTQGVGNSPNSPALTPSWPSAKTAWLVGLGMTDVATNVSAYPNGYTNGVESGTTVSPSVGLASARRLNEVASEDPDAWSTSGGSQGYVMATIGIRPATIIS